MKKLKSLLYFLIALPAFLAAQPANDDCSGAIHLGTAPACPDSTFFSNAGSSASDIGDSNTPSCFSGGVESDVWFTFTTDAAILNYTITATSQPDGPTPAAANLQVALYRGSCTTNGLAEIACAAAATGTEEAVLQVEGLTPNVTYYLRVDTYTPSGEPSQGAFQLCIQERQPEYTIDEGGSSACSGVLFDSGGADGDYGDNENHTFTICPDSPHDCILFSLDYYFIEPQSMGSVTDLLTFYDGPQANPGNIIAQLGSFNFEDDGGGGVCYQVAASSGCLTVQFISDAQVAFEGFQGHWECSVNCETPSPISVESNISNQQVIDFVSTPSVRASITNIECPAAAYGAFQTDEASGLGLERGLLLTTGTLAWAVGPNFDPGNGTFTSNNFAPGDPGLDYLSQLSGNNFLSENACVVELEVFANTNELTFEYIFGSEEYQEFVGQEYNDIFAFLISGPGITGDPNINNQQNIAILPNGNNTPVEINSVNQSSNWEYYRNNNNGIATQYDGLTSDFLGRKKSLTARADVVPCQTYRLKLAIADRGDPFYDSGVFISELRGGAPQLAVNFNSGINYLAENCTDTPDELSISLTAPSNDTIFYQVEIEGTATPGTDYILDLPDTVFFPPGATSLTFPITALSDQEHEAEETIIIRLTNDFGCGAIVYAEIQVNLADELNVSINSGQDTAYICGDSTLALEATGASSYFWSPVSVFDDPATPNPIANPVADQWVTVEGVLGPCVSYDSIFLRRLTPSLEVKTLGPAAICRGDSTQLLANNNVSGFSLQWSPAGELDDPGSEQPFVAPQESTTYFATLDITGCVVRDSVTIDVAVLDFPTVIPDTTLCGSSSTQLATGVPPQSTTTLFQWSPSAGLDNDTIAAPLASPEETTTYQLIATAANGACADTASVTVTVLPTELQINTPDTLEICLGRAVELSATSNAGTPEAVVWSPDDGSLNTTTGLAVVATPTVSTWYYATLEQPPCTVLDSVFIRVDSLPNTSITANPGQAIYCQGDQVQLLSPAYPPGHFPDIEHQWTPSTGLATSDTLWNTVVVVQDAMLYQRITTNRACRDTAAIFLNVAEPPVSSLFIEGPSGPICTGDSIQLLAASTGSAITGPFLWEGSDGSSQEGAQQVFTPTAPVVYTLTYVGPGGCDTLSASLEIEVKPPPEVSLETDPPGLDTGQQGSPIALSAFTNLPPPLNFIWALNEEVVQQGAGLDVYEAVLSLDPSIFTVVVEDPETGCRDSASIAVEVIPPVVRVPNTFTPNGDGHNDFFRYVAGGNIRRILAFRVFNRWGQVVFEEASSTPESFPGWDGTFRGEPQPSEVYFYQIRLERFDGEVEEWNGEVSLLR